MPAAYYLSVLQQKTCSCTAHGFPACLEGVTPANCSLQDGLHPMQWAWLSESVHEAKSGPSCLAIHSPHPAASAPHLNLWQSSWCWWDAYEVKLTQQLVVSSHLTLSLEHLDANLKA